MGSVDTGHHHARIHFNCTPILKKKVPPFFWRQNKKKASTLETWETRCEGETESAH